MTHLFTCTKSAKCYSVTQFTQQCHPLILTLKWLLSLHLKTYNLLHFQKFSSLRYFNLSMNTPICKYYTTLDTKLLIIYLLSHHQHQQNLKCFPYSSSSKPNEICEKGANARREDAFLPSPFFIYNIFH